MAVSDTGNHDAILALVETSNGVEAQIAHQVTNEFKTIAVLDFDKYSLGYLGIYDNSIKNTLIMGYVADSDSYVFYEYANDELTEVTCDAEITFGDNVVLCNGKKTSITVSDYTSVLVEDEATTQVDSSETILDFVTVLDDFETNNPKYWLHHPSDDCIYIATREARFTVNNNEYYYVSGFDTTIYNLTEGTEYEGFSSTPEFEAIVRDENGIYYVCIVDAHRATSLLVYDLINNCEVTREHCEYDDNGAVITDAMKYWMSCTDIISLGGQNE